MKKSRFTEEQMVMILREADGSTVLAKDAPVLEAVKDLSAQAGQVVSSEHGQGLGFRLEVVSMVCPNAACGAQEPTRGAARRGPSWLSVLI